MEQTERRPLDFFIAGAAKAGTTSLFHYLNQHDRIYLPVKEKEPGFYCDIWGITDEEYYFGLFEEAGADQLIGEASTAYLTCKSSPSLIHADNPDAKIIILLRNPAQRSFSLYLQMVKTGLERLPTFEQALAAEEQRAARDPHAKLIPGLYHNFLYFGSGIYAPQVKRYFDQFTRDRVKVIIFEEMATNTEKTVSDCLEFLGLPRPFTFDATPRNMREYPRWIFMQHFLKRGVEDVSRSIGFEAGIRASKICKNINLKYGSPPKMSPETYEELRERYKPSIAELEELLGRDLSLWQK